jgi:hypothetical protein
MEAARLEVDRKIATERVEKYNRIDADRLEADRATVAQLAAKYLEEDATHARVVAADRLETDQRLAAERLKIDALNAEQVAVKRQKTEKVQAEKTAAERLKDDVKLELEFAEADRRLDAERLEADRRLVPLKNNGSQRVNRKHRRSDEIGGRLELKTDMNRVFTRFFEEKKGENILISKVYDIFRKSTSLSSVDYNVFKYHCRTIFCAQWTHSRVIFSGDSWWFTDMAVKLN